MTMELRTLVASMLLLLALAAGHPAPATGDAPQIAFARAELLEADPSSSIDVHFAIEASLGEEAYRFARDSSGRISVLGGDATGAMYGALDLAEAIRLGTLDLVLADTRTRTPRIQNRGIKFNIPLDLRTPSYSDSSDAGQANIPVMWEREFWVALLDDMARHRYNVLSLWSLHPFPSMVSVPEFPEVALDDVWRTRARLDESFGFTGTDMVRSDMLADHEVVKHITIDEKIAFWRWVMQRAHDRGIAIYVFTWNVFTWGAEGKHGITRGMERDITKQYFRASVREMVKTYPLLAGFGITAGEAMPHAMDPKIKEKWLWDTYGEGVRDALRDNPGRIVRMIHRFHWTAQGDILDAWKDYPGFPATFDFSFKYSVAHMYSVANPPFIQPLLENIRPGMRTWLTVRNDDIYTFRFGDPDYMRAYVAHMPPSDVCAGFYMGPDGYIWGRSFLERDAAAGPRPLVIEKQWYAFMLMGRLSYDPTLTNSHFERALGARHPGVDATALASALKGAAQTMPLITRFFWGDIDLKWYPEACLSHPRSKGYYTVRHFVEGITMPGSKVLSIREWREALVSGAPMDGTTPPAIAAALDGAADDTIRNVTSIRQSMPPADSELAAVLDDCDALAWLARYYAAKIRAACALGVFDLNSDPAERTAAVRHLEQALAAWKHYAIVRDARYVPALYNRVGHVDVTALTAKADADIGIARSWVPGSVTRELPQGGTEKGFKP